MKKLVPICLFLIHGAAEAQTVPPPPKGSGNGAGVLAVDPANDSCLNAQAKLDQCAGDLAECERLKKAAEEDRKALEDVCGITAGQAREKQRRQGDKPQTSAKPKGKWLTRIDDLPAGNDMCPNGGKVKVGGHDKDNDGELDRKEIEARVYACKGDPGAGGTSGPMTFVVFEPIPAVDATCPDGGILFVSLKDTNGNGQPDEADEVLAKAPQCAVRGPQGLQGDPGAPAEAGGRGSDGRPGRDGRDGTAIGIGPAVTADAISSASEPTTYSSAFGLVLTVEHGSWEWTAAALWSPGIDRGSVLKTDLTYYVWRGLGVEGGVKLVYAGIDEENEANSQFILGSLGVNYQVLDKGHWKARVGVRCAYGLSGAGGEMSPGAKSCGGDGFVAYEF